MNIKNVWSLKKFDEVIQVWRCFIIHSSVLLLFNQHGERAERKFFLSFLAKTKQETFYCLRMESFVDWCEDSEFPSFVYSLTLESWPEKISRRGRWKEIKGLRNLLNKCPGISHQIFAIFFSKIYGLPFYLFAILYKK